MLSILILGLVDAVLLPAMILVVGRGVARPGLVFLSAALSLCTLLFLAAAREYVQVAQVVLFALLLLAIPTVALAAGHIVLSVLVRPLTGDSSLALEAAIKGGPRGPDRNPAPVETGPSLATAVGTNGTVLLYPDRIQIVRHGVSAALMIGPSARDEFGLDQIKGTEFRPPSIVHNGYVRFLLHGATVQRPPLLSLVGDEGTVFFRRSQQTSFRRLIGLVEEQRARSQ